MDDYTDPATDNLTNQVISLQTNFVLPFSNYDNQSIMAIAGFYALLFILGTCGNSAILAVVHHVRGTDCRARHNTTLIYICVLSVVDFISMLPLPTTIIDQILGFWMFGTFTCKLFRLLEHIGKIFSTFILVCLSFDRYCAVCHPLQAQLRTNRLAHLMLTILFGFTCIMLAPIAIFARSKEIIIFERYNNQTRELTVLHLYKCVDDLGKRLFVLFSLTCFVIAYLLPLILMVFFYNGMLWRLFKQTRAVRKVYQGKHNPISRIAIYTLAICLFHFVCWTPYWISVLYSLYLEVFLPPDEAVLPSPAFIYFMYGVHALPYINSASNFILYGLLNRQVRLILS
uniref:G_PROTEIN_RECEP_F1_2 domain-containing protein n=1 Tax=Syphacia muris TaxID=451379 RepID=A0A0N5AUG3_9BILA